MCEPYVNQKVSRLQGCIRTSWKTNIIALNHFAFMILNHSNTNDVLGLLAESGPIKKTTCSSSDRIKREIIKLAELTIGHGHV